VPSWAFAKPKDPLGRAHLPIVSCSGPAVLKDLDGLSPPGSPRKIVLVNDVNSLYSMPYGRVIEIRNPKPEIRNWLRLIDLHDDSGLENDRNYLVKEVTELMNIFGSILVKSK